MNTYLITGKSGFVGKHLEAHLIEKGWKEDLDQPTVIFNLASWTDKKKAWENPQACLQTNVELAVKAGELAKKLKPKKLIHVSTNEVYQPKNPYAISKLCQLEILNGYKRMYQIPLVEAPIANPFGEGQLPSKFFSQCVQKIERGETLTVEDVSHPHSYVKNVVIHLEELVFKDCEFVYALWGKPLNNVSLAARIAEKMDRPLKIKIKSGVEEGPSYSKENFDVIPFDEAIQRTVNWELGNREGRWTELTGI